MAHRKTSKRSKAKTMLRLADLEQSKNAVLHSLGAASSQESYGHAIDEFIGWYCSEPFQQPARILPRNSLELEKAVAENTNLNFMAETCHPGRCSRRSF
jgi:hypothetical protein